MPSSIAWGLLLAGLCCLAPASLAEGLQGDAVQDTGASQRDQESASRKIAPNLANFAFSFYHHVARQPNTTNIFFSPLSIVTAFAMLSLGAKGETHAQILQGLYFNLKKVPEADIHAGLGHLLYSLNRPDYHYQLVNGSVLFIDQSLNQVHTFGGDGSRVYHPGAFSIEIINFRDTKSKTQINSYLEKKTQGKIVDLVKDLDKDTVFALVNYIFFTGKWEDAIEAERLIEGDFHVDPKTTIKVPMTQQLGYFHLYQDCQLSCWVLQQRYKGRVYSLLILPNPGMMKEVENRLSLRHISKILTAMDIRSASLHLPKLSMSGTYDLKTTLGQMGITKVFSNGAELPGISEEVPLKLSKALHNAVLTIENEERHSGTTFSEESAWFRHLVIEFNRPFLIIIMDKKTNIPLFVGKMVNPVQK